MEGVLGIIEVDFRFAIGSSVVQGESQDTEDRIPGHT